MEMDKTYKILKRFKTRLVAVGAGDTEDRIFRVFPSPTFSWIEGAFSLGIGWGYWNACIILSAEYKFR